MLRAIGRLYTLASTAYWRGNLRSYALTWAVCTKRPRLRYFLKYGLELPIMNGIVDIRKVGYLNEEQLISRHLSRSLLTPKK